MQTSAEGIAALEQEEGVVLKAYRCPAGRWTIGAGLTGASGVVQPRAGMTITREQATALLALALARNYEPRVRKAMARVHIKQHEFDAGVSFDFNTGAIHKASWVRQWLLNAAPAVIRAALEKWNKGGGKVLPGLVARRKREADLLLLGVYPAAAPVTAPASGAAWARWGLSLTSTEKAEARAALARLGYAVGEKLDAVALSAARDFQRDHGLTVDGILGRASLSTLQRRIDAAAQGKASATATAAAGAGTAAGASETIALPPQLDWLVLGLAAAFALWTAWRYRDAVAATIQRPLPRVAALLRSF